MEDVMNEVRAVDKLKTHGDCENILFVDEHDWLQPERRYCYLDMECCEGNLEHYIQNSGRTRHYQISPNPRFLAACFPNRGIWNTWDIMEQIANGIQFIHECGEIHRDLKPLLFSSTTFSWKIADFGLTTQGTSKRAHTTRYSRGTTGYRAPELLTETARYTNKVDIFAMGCILFEVATGRKAFNTDFAIHEYARGRSRVDLAQLELGVTEQSRFAVLGSMVSIPSSKRPSASELRKSFSIYRCLSLGEAFKQKGDHDSAIQAYRSATHDTSNCGFAWKGIGDAFCAQNRYDEAIEAYKTADKTGHTSSVTTLAALGDAFYSNGDLKLAIKAYTDALANLKALLENNDSAISARGIRTIEKREEAAEQCLDTKNMNQLAKVYKQAIYDVWYEGLEAGR